MQHTPDPFSAKAKIHHPHSTSSPISEELLFPGIFMSGNEDTIRAPDPACYVWYNLLESR